METKPLLVDSGEMFLQAGLPHRVLRPAGNGPFPTVVMLHGRYGSEDVMWVFGRTLPKNWLVVSPRAHLADGDGFSWILQKEGQWPALADFGEAAEVISRFVEALPDLYQADPARIYLMGFSQGAAASFATAVSYPGMVQGIASLVGFMPINTTQLNLAAGLHDLPVFMAVGKKDPLIPYEVALACVQTLRMAGADLEAHEYDTGHKLNKQGIQDLTDWWADRKDG